MMYEKLEEYGVNYITNEYVLKEKSETEQVFNVNTTPDTGMIWGPFTEPIIF